MDVIIHIKQTKTIRPLSAALHLHSFSSNSDSHSDSAVQRRVHMESEICRVQIWCGVICG